MSRWLFELILFYLAMLKRIYEAEVFLSDRSKIRIAEPLMGYNMRGRKGY